MWGILKNGMLRFFRTPCRFFHFVSVRAHTLKVWVKVYTTFEETSGFVLVLDLFIHILSFLFSVIERELQNNSKLEPDLIVCTHVPTIRSLDISWTEF
jgi:hypothetical protein